MATPTMSNTELLELIVGLTALFGGFTTVMFIVFSRFLNREKLRGENFRAVHKDD